MMFGAGLNEIGCAADGGGFFGNGWTVIGLMGFGLLLTILLIGGIVWLIASQRPRVQHAGYATVQTASPGTSNGDHAFEIVRARFARGEVDREEYDRLMTALRS